MFKSVKKAAPLCGMLLIFPAIAFAGLAVSPGVTTEMLDKIDAVEDESMRQMLISATIPNYGELYLDLDRPADELNQFEKNYKSHPLTWDERVENLNFILENNGELKDLSVDNVEYMDISFGESVIPVQDRRVTEILETDFLLEEIARLEEEKEAAWVDLYEKGAGGLAFQDLEDEYAIKLATLMQVENRFKEAKVDFLRLKNQQEFGRITDEEFNEKTLGVVEDFESFVALSGEVQLFNEDELKAVANKIYTDVSSEEGGAEAPTDDAGLVNEKAWYSSLSVILMILP